MNRKTGTLAVIAIIAITVFGFISYSSYRNSEEATVERLATALIEKDTETVKQYMPSYSNKKKDFKKCTNRLLSAGKEDEKRTGCEAAEKGRAFHD